MSLFKLILLSNTGLLPCAFAQLNPEISGMSREEIIVAPVEPKPILSPPGFCWSLFLDEAQKRAEESDLPILVLFTGPDWNAPCQELEKNVLIGADFKEYVTSRFIPLKVALYVNSYQNPKGKAFFCMKYLTCSSLLILLVSVNALSAAKPITWNLCRPIPADEPRYHSLGRIEGAETLVISYEL